MFAIFKKGKDKKYKFYAALQNKDGVDIELDHSRILREEPPKVLDLPDFDFNKIEQYEGNLNA